MSDHSNADFWKTNSELDIQGLLDALKSEDKHIRRRAAAALRSMKDVRAISALKDAHQSEEDAETGLNIASAIEVLTDLANRGLGRGAASEDPAEVVHGLIATVTSDAANPDAIVEAAEKLGQIGDKRAVEALILAFNNQKHTIHVRLAIAEALLKLESAPVEVALLANLRHQDWHIRRNGAAILGQLRAEWAIQPLSDALNDPHPVVRRTALAALKHIGTPESRKALARYTPSEDQRSKPAAAAPSSVSGIEVKRPGKSVQDDTSPLLKRLAGRKKDAEDEELAGTRPPSSESSSERVRRFQPTQPLRENMLDQLDAILDEDGRDEEDES